MIFKPENNFDEEIKEGIVLVDFWASWCVPCKKLEPVLVKLEPIAKIIKVNIDNELDLAKRFNIKAVPTIIIFKDGKLMNTYIGIQQYDILKTYISSLKDTN